MQSALDRHLVLPLDPAMKDETPTLDNGKAFPWGPQHAFHVKDAGEAEALKQKYGKRLDYARMASPDVHDRGHRYFFAVGNVPWKRKVRDAEEDEKENDGQDDDGREGYDDGGQESPAKAQG